MARRPLVPICWNGRVGAEVGVERGGGGIGESPGWSLNVAVAALTSAKPESGGALAREMHVDDQSLSAHRLWLHLGDDCGGGRVAAWPCARVSDARGSLRLLPAIGSFWARLPRILPRSVAKCACHEDLPADGHAEAGGMCSYAQQRSFVAPTMEPYLVALGSASLPSQPRY